MSSTLAILPPELQVPPEETQEPPEPHEPSVQETLVALVAPVREAADRLDAVIEEKQAELALLRDERKKLVAILSIASGERKKPGPKQAKGATVRPDALEYVREFLTRGLVDRDHIVAAQVLKAIQADAKKRGIKVGRYPGHDSVQDALKAMHSVGELQLRSVRGRGGSSIYKDLRSRETTTTTT